MFAQCAPPNSRIMLGFRCPHCADARRTRRANAKFTCCLSSASLVCLWLQGPRDGGAKPPPGVPRPGVMVAAKGRPWQLVRGASRRRIVSNARISAWLRGVLRDEGNCVENAAPGLLRAQLPRTSRPSSWHHPVRPALQSSESQKPISSAVILHSPNSTPSLAN